MIQRVFLNGVSLKGFTFSGAVGADAAGKVGGRAFCYGDPTPSAWIPTEYRQWHEDGKVKAFAQFQGGDYLLLIGKAEYHSVPSIGFYEERLVDVEIVRMKVDGVPVINPKFEQVDTPVE